MSLDLDHFRRDGRTTGYVSSTRTIKSSILRMLGGFVYLDNFPEPVWFSEYMNMPLNKPMWFFLAKGPKNWRIVDYLENTIDKVEFQLKKESWG